MAVGTETPAVDTATVDESAPRSRRASAWWMRPAFPVSAAAIAAGVWSMAVSRTLFPFLSNDHDEAVYLLQSDAIAHGHLFPRAPAPGAAYLPWLSVQHGDVYVPKYAPVFASMLAAAKVALTSERAALAVIAAGVIVGTYFLAREVLPERSQAVFAAIVMLCTPLFLIQVATFLPYTASLLMLTWFAFALLRGLRVGRSRWFAIAGFLAGLAFFARSYDAVLVALPLLVYLVVHEHRRFRTLAAHVGWLVLGAVPVLIAMAAFDRAATGSATQSPFSLLDSRDTLGFGNRAMDPNNPAVHYTPGLGLSGLTRHVVLSGFWCFGGLVLVGLAVWFAIHAGRHGPTLAFAAVMITLPLGYLFFWGTYGAAVWGAPWYLGPYYYMPIFAPLTILGTGGFFLLRERFRAVATAALIGMVALSAGVLANSIRENRSFTQDDRRLNAALTDAHLHNALVFLPAFYGERLLHPFATARNSWDVSGNVIYAVDRGDAANLEVIADHPDRTAYKVTIVGQYRDTPPDPTLTSTLDPVDVRGGHTIDAVIDFRSPGPQPLITIVTTARGHTDVWVIDTHAHKGAHEHAMLRVDEHGAVLTGPVARHTRAATSDDSQLHVAVIASAADGTRATNLSVHTLGLHVRNGDLLVMLPGQAANTAVTTEPVTFRAR